MAKLGYSPNGAHNHFSGTQIISSSLYKRNTKFVSKNVNLDMELVAIQANGMATTLD